MSLRDGLGRQAIYFEHIMTEKSLSFAKAATKR